MAKVFFKVIDYSLFKTKDGYAYVELKDHPTVGSLKEAIEFKYDVPRQNIVVMNDKSMEFADWYSIIIVQHHNNGQIPYVIRRPYLFPGNQSYIKKIEEQEPVQSLRQPVSTSPSIPEERQRRSLSTLVALNIMIGKSSKRVAIEVYSKTIDGLRKAVDEKHIVSGNYCFSSRDLIVDEGIPIVELKYHVLECLEIYVRDSIPANVIEENQDLLVESSVYQIERTSSTSYISRIRVRLPHLTSVTQQVLKITGYPSKAIKIAHLNGVIPAFGEEIESGNEYKIIKRPEFTHMVPIAPGLFRIKIINNYNGIGDFHVGIPDLNMEISDLYEVIKKALQRFTSMTQETFHDFVMLDDNNKAFEPHSSVNYRDVTIHRR